MRLPNIFEGKLTKKEYWIHLIVTLFLILIVKNLPGADQSLGDPSVRLPLFLIIIGIVYYWSILIRRLHDMGKSGWYSLITLIPLIGIFYIIILGASESKTKKSQNKP